MTERKDAPVPASRGSEEWHEPRAEPGLKSGPPRKIHGDPIDHQLRGSDPEVTRGRPEERPTGAADENRQVPDYDRAKPTKPD